MGWVCGFADALRNVGGTGGTGGRPNFELCNCFDFSSFHVKSKIHACLARCQLRHDAAHDTIALRTHPTHTHSPVHTPATLVSPSVTLRYHAFVRSCRRCVRGCRLCRRGAVRMLWPQADRPRSVRLLLRLAEPSTRCVVGRGAWFAVHSCLLVCRAMSELPCSPDAGCLACVQAK